MALSPELLNFKSSGVYRVEIDRSQTTTFTLSNLRFLVGHSRKGPYNTPVLIENTEQFSQIFGSIDRNLERKGMFFHRSVINALSRGPVIAFNVLPTDSNDTLDWFEPVTNGSVSETAQAGDGTDLEYSTAFDRDKFWFPSDLKILEEATIDNSHVIRFVNLKQDPITVIIRHALNVDSFKIKARDWYGEGNVPEYMNENDYVSDFMIDVFVFKGEFNPSQLQNDPVFGSYFTATGIDKTKLNQFANLRQVDLLAQYTGSLIPNFRDLEGRSLYIENTINNETSRTGLFCAVDEDLVTDPTGTKLDLVGHTYTTDGTQYELFSYALTDTDRVKSYSFTNYANSGGNIFTFEDAGTAPIKVGDYVKALALDRLAKVIKISKSGNIYTVTCDDAVPLTASPLTHYVLSFESAVTEYVPFVLGKAIIGEKTIEDCLDALTYGTNLYKAITDKDLIDFRYIVDTFGSFEDGTILNKHQLAQLAHDRQSVSAILNAPGISEFKKSTDPSFTDANGDFKVSYIATGGNLEKNTLNVYSLPTIQQGSNYAFYYGPHLSVVENGKTILVPPAAYVSNNYIDKYNNDLPWSIVAGPRRGVVSGINVRGVEYAFDKADRDILEPFGINPIVFQRGVGLTILGNKTAQQNIKSALSSAHVREVLIYIQNQMADILKNYVFEFNTAQTRLEIKTLADSLMESIKQNEGIYDYRNIMDQTNNTPDVIDNNIGIIDTYVEPVKGLEIVVHRTTINNTGEIQTGNFI